MDLASLRRHLRENVVAYLALFLALGGGAYAAKNMRANSVKSKQIRDGQVKSQDLADDSVVAQKVKDGSLRASDFAKGELPRGSRGERGLPGEPGLPGAPGLSNYEQVERSSVFDATNAKTVTASCSSSTAVLIGGGAFVEGNAYTSISIDGDAPVASPTHPEDTTIDTWTASAHEHAAVSSPWAIHAYALCADVAG